MLELYPQIDCSLNTEKELIKASNTDMLDPQKVANINVFLELCIFSCNRMQSVQNLGLALISMLGGLIVEKKGYLMLEMFYLVWLCGMLLFTSVLFLSYWVSLIFTVLFTVFFSLDLSLCSGYVQIFNHYYGIYPFKCISQLLQI